jgi:hypothetical protein
MAWGWSGERAVLEWLAGLDQASDVLDPLVGDDTDHVAVVRVDDPEVVSDRTGNWAAAIMRVWSQLAATLPV